MAPEQAEGNDDIDAAADQFALGVIVYEMLTGRSAFTGDTLAAVIYKIVHKDPYPLVLLRPDLPPRVQEVLAVALSKDRKRRFPSTSHFARQLREAAGQRPDIREVELDDVTVIDWSLSALAAASPAPGPPARLGSTRAYGASPPAEPSAGDSPADGRRGAGRRRQSPTGWVAREMVHASRVFRGPSGRFVMAGGGLLILGVLAFGLSRSNHGRGARVGLAGPVAKQPAPTREQAAPSAAGERPPPPPSTARPASNLAVTSIPVVPLVTSLPSAEPTGAARVEGVALVSFELASDPPGLPVLIDGGPFPNAQQQTHTSTHGALPAGAHKVELASAGYRTWSKLIELKPGRPNRFLARLQRDDPPTYVARPNQPEERPSKSPPTGAVGLERSLKPPPLPAHTCSMTIGSVPWAELWVDGTNTHRATPVVALLAPCGHHRIELKRADLPIHLATDVELAAGEALKRVFRFDASGRLVSARP